MTIEETKVFISHASEDKISIADDLAKILAKRVRIWYDEFSIVAGGSIFQSVNRGLVECDFGVIILSKAFFEKKWTTSELAGLFGREDFGTKIIPVWHHVNYKEVSSFSPIIADRKAIYSSEGVLSIADSILKRIRNAELKSTFVHTGSVDDKFAALAQKQAAVKANSEMYFSRTGAQTVSECQTDFFKIALKRVQDITSSNPSLKFTA